MPSSDTNLKHLTTKALLLICGAHRPRLTARHAERIKGNECKEKGTSVQNNAPTNKQKYLSHFQMDTDIFFVLGSVK